MLKKSRGSAPVPTPLNRATTGGLPLRDFTTDLDALLGEFLILTADARKVRLG
jgi:hypothetical protein